MRRFMAGLLLVGIFVLPAAAQRYRAPTGNCDAAVMLLEAARVANTKAVADLATAMREETKICSAATLKAADARVSTAERLSQRAEGLLMACPGMDDAMAQGEKMTGLAKTEMSDAALSRRKLDTCRH